MPSVSTFVHLVEEHGYVFLFLIALVEGPIITIIGAFLAAKGYFDIFIVYAVVVAADLASDILLYGVGRVSRVDAFGGLRALLGATTGRFLKLERAVERHGGKLVLFAKYSQTAWFVLPAAGAARMPIGKFFGYNVIGALPKSFILVVIGYYFGYAYDRIDSYFERAGLVAAFVVLALGAYLFVRRGLSGTVDEVD
jgi:membrane protein DedA with SNARE-associated domain